MELPTNSLGCDESKCVSRGTSHLHNGSFTCYGDDGTYYPMMCSDGFVPMMADDEPPYIVQNPDNKKDLSVWYFTCCPPHPVADDENDDGYYLESTNTNSTDDDDIAVDYTRHCSGPVLLTTEYENSETSDNEYQTIDTICKDQDLRIYPRRMESSATQIENLQESVMCCDSIVPAPEDDYNDDAPTGSIISASNFLDDTDCVLYHNEWYDASPVRNEIGRLGVRFCDLQDFTVPRPLDDFNNTASEGSYRCCKNGPPLSPFLQDEAFRVTVDPIIVLFSISAVVSLIVGLALLIPLLTQLRSGSYKERIMILERPTWGRTKSTMKLTKSSGRSSSTGSSNGKRRYSTYNLYLVYMAAIDFIYSVFMIGWFGSYKNQQFNPNFYGPMVYPYINSNENYYNDQPSSASTSVSFEDLVVIDFNELLVFPYGIANMWICAILCFQILHILRTSQRQRRVQQPSLRRVNVQAGVISFVSATLGIVLFFLAGSGRDFQNNPMLFISLSSIMGVLVVPPCLYIFNASFLIWCRRYIPSRHKTTPRDAKLRELSLCFFSLVAVFVLIWGPAALLSIYATETGESWMLVLSACMTAVQPILSAMVILAKSDSRKYIVKFLTCSYVFGINCNCKNDKVVSATRRRTNSRFVSSGDAATSSSAPPESSSVASTSTNFHRATRRSSTGSFADLDAVADDQEMDEMVDGDNINAVEADAEALVFLQYTLPFRGKPKKKCKGGKRRTPSKTVLFTGETVTLDDVGQVSPTETSQVSKPSAVSLEDEM